MKDLFRLILVALVVLGARQVYSDSYYNLGALWKPSCAPSTIKEVQSVGTSAVIGTTVTATLTPTTGNFLVAITGFDTSSSQNYLGTTVTVSDTLGNTWYSTPQAGTIPGVQIWYAMNVSGGSSDTVTAVQTLPYYNTPAETNIDISVTEYSGVATTHALDVVIASQGAGASAYSSPMTTTAKCDLVVAAFVTGNGGGYTGPGTGYVQRFLDASDSPFAIYEDNIGSLAPQGASVAATAHHDATGWGVVQAAFRSSTSSGPAQTPSKVVLTTSAQSLSTWQCSSAVTAQAQNASSQPVNTTESINIALSAPTAMFFSDSSCNYAITNATINGGTNSVSFYVMFPDTSNGAITATPAGYSVLNQTETLSLDPYTWIGGGSCDGNFNTAACWQNSSVPTSQTAHFDSTCVSNCDVTFNGNEGASLWLHNTFSHSINQGAYNLSANTFRQDAGTYTITSGTFGALWVYQLGGTFNAGAANLSLGGLANYFLGGTFNPGTSTATFDAGGTRDLYIPNGITFYNVVTSSNENVPVQGGNITINGNLTMTSTSGLDFYNGTLSIGGNLANTSTGYNFYGSTVVFTPGTNHTITGTTNFYNLTMDDSGNSASDTLTFGSGSTTNISNTLTLKGNSTHDLMLRSSSGGTQWNISPQATRTIANIDVEDSDNINATPINVIGTGSINSGDNTNWGFSYATPALIQSPAQLDSTCTACTSASLSPTAPNDLIVVAIVNGSTTTATSVSDNASTPNTYTKARSKTNTGACEIWYSVGSLSASQVTVNYAAAQSPAVYVYEFSGTALSATKDKTASASNTSTSLAATTAATSIAGEVVVSAAYATSALTLTSFTGNTILGPSSNYDAAYQIESATGTYGATWTQATSSNWAECTATFEALLH